MTALLYRGDPERGQDWRSSFQKYLPGVEFRFWPETGTPDDIRYLATWQPVEGAADRFPNLEVIFSTGAGVDQFDLAEIPPSIQLVRLIDPAIVNGMREYVVMAVLLLQRNLIEYQLAKGRRTWEECAPNIAESVTVGVLGLGVLGRAVIEALKPFGHQLRAWSRTMHSVEGVDCFAGSKNLFDFASGCDIVVCLLPLTDATRHILDRRLFDAMPPGASLVNVGRGGHLVESDLLTALGDGTISAAVLDVFDEEPLPAEHPFWSHERILMTPHVASTTGHKSAAIALIENIRRHLSGEPMIGLVDRESGY